MLKKKQLWHVLGLFICFSISKANAQSNYSDYTQLSKRLQRLQSQNPDISKLTSLTKTVGGYSIWSLTLGKGDLKNKPAIAIISGVDGKHILGPEMAVTIAENMVQNHSDILENTTFYIFPNMSPNATENYFSSVKHYKNGNARDTDNDRDGRLNEDPFEDINKDGLITLMRIEDPTGNYIKLKEDERILVKANKNKGQLGAYKLLSEGIDNDKDGLFNEDGKGGVHFNKNFSFNYPYFTSGAGEHPVSEKENRALLDFLYEQWNIFAVITIGPENNLSTPLKYNPSGARKRVVTSILKNDADLNKFLSNEYTKITKTKGAPKTNRNGGSFFEWSYFHFGKLALSTPGWWAPKFKGDSTVKASKNTQANFLQWANKEGIKNAFVPWKEIKHPDFPNQKVEVGGIAPYVMDNPPFNKVDEISEKHTNFIVALTKMQPKVVLQNLKAEAVDGGFTRITVDVHNKGLIPTHTDMGKRSRWLRRIKVALNTSKSQEIISGKKITLLESIDGDSSVQFSWLVNGKGAVTIEAGASHTGITTAKVQLK